MTNISNIKKAQRQYLPQNLEIKDWASIENFFIELYNREINSVDELKKWMKDASELEAAISEDFCWRQIKMTCDTTDKTLEESFNFACTQIQPHIQPWADKINRKLIENPFTQQLNQNEYFTYLRNIKNSIELFNEKNIPLQAELAVKQQQFGAIAGAMIIEVEGKEYTLQQAAKFLENEDRSLRELVYRKIQERRLQDVAQLDELFNELLKLRNKIAENAGFENFINYRYKELGRFDYTPKDCEQFWISVKEYIVPIVDKINNKKKQALGYEDLRPWDTEAPLPNEKPLRPFTNGDDLLQKVIAVFDDLNIEFGNCLRKMNELKQFDLDSRKGKAPGGYNCPLAETGAPFIFMNAAGQMSDVTTMLHEGGHALHSFLAHPLSLNGFKEYPTEMAEVASMAMELMSMSAWHKIFDNEKELIQAKKHQLERCISIFPWIAIVDKFQHWLYSHINHTNEERSQAWQNIVKEFRGSSINYNGLEKYATHSWQRQLHLFEVPFYYIEYGIAQLGAIGIWMQYKNDAKTALQNYCNALALGGTKTLPELYKAAGIEFNFSGDYIKKLAQFVIEEYEKL